MSLSTKLSALSCSLMSFNFVGVGHTTFTGLLGWKSHRAPWDLLSQHVHTIVPGHSSPGSLATSGQMHIDFMCTLGNRTLGLKT